MGEQGIFRLAVFVHLRSIEISAERPRVAGQSRASVAIGPALRRLGAQCLSRCKERPAHAGKESSSLHKCACASRFSGRRLVDDFFRGRIPIDAPPRPVRPRGHHADDRMRKPVIDIGIRLFAVAHRAEPVHKVNHIVVIGADGIGRRSARHANDFRLLLCRTQRWQLDCAVKCSASSRETYSERSEGWLPLAEKGARGRGGSPCPRLSSKRPGARSALRSAG